MTPLQEAQQKREAFERWRAEHEPPIQAEVDSMPIEAVDARLAEFMGRPDTTVFVCGGTEDGRMPESDRRSLLVDMLMLEMRGDS